MRFTNILNIEIERPHLSPTTRFSRVSFSSTPCILSQTGTYLTPEECLAATSCGWKYKCDNGACVQAPDGTYETQAECFDKCSKFGCDGTGACVRQPGGQYNTKEECKCFDCIDNACAPVGANVQGNYATLSECQDDPVKKCGWKYACDGTGACVLQRLGQYDTAADCKCFGCIDNACAPVTANTQGDYATLTDCEYDPVRQCGWKYACAADGDPETLCKLVPGPDGVYGTAEECQCVSPMGPPGPTCVCGFSSTVQGDAPFHSVTQCQADATDMCGWKYTCPPPPLSFAIEAGGKTGLTVGDGCNPAFVYIALGPAFVAYTSAAEITVGTPRARVTGSVTPSYVEVRLVVASIGNYDTGKLDPTTDTKTIRVGASTSCPGSPYDRTVNVGANVVAAANSLILGGADIPSTEFPTFTNTRVALQPGWRYQVFAQIFAVTFNKPGVTWTGGQINLV